MQSVELSSTDDVYHADSEKRTVYHKLATLCNEIEEQIRCSAGDALETQNDILKIRAEAFKQNSPEAEYALRLFRKYASEVVPAREALAGKGEQSEDTICLTDEIPLFLYQGSSEPLIGTESLKRNIFWFRISATMFSFLAFVIISFVPNIHDRTIDAKKLFNAQCGYYNDPELRQGRFSFIPYQYVLAVTVVMFVYCSLVVGYYLLPLNSAGVKYIPGLSEILVRFLNPVEVVEGSNRASSFLRRYAISVESLGDGALLLFGLVSFVIAAVSIDEPIEFGNGKDATFFSLSTFVSTFMNTNPVCVNNNIVSLLRGGLAMAFLSFVSLALCFQVSARSLYLENHKTQQQLPVRSPCNSSVDSDSVTL